MKKEFYSDVPHSQGECLIGSFHVLRARTHGPIACAGHVKGFQSICLLIALECVCGRVTVQRFDGKAARPLAIYDISAGNIILNAR